MTSAPERDIAYPNGTDPAALARALNQAHDDFVTTGRAHARLRPVVLASWLRSVQEGVDPERAQADVDLDTAALEAARGDHPLAEAMPTIRRLLVDSAAEAGLLVAVSDAAGRLLWVEGSSSLRSRAESIAFVEGANWSESRVGTNAPGTALALDRAVQIFGAEHLSRPVTPWSCSAAPIHDPASGALMGVLDLTGGPEVAAPQSLSLVRATVAAVEAELRLHQLVRTQPDEPWTRTAHQVRQTRSALQVLGTRGALLTHGSTSTRLSLRHSELLFLLATSPQGLSASELAAALGHEERASVTVRAELSRLRALIKPVRMHSRPYLLSGPIDLDATRVRAALRHGQLRRAVAEYHGPLLARSAAPAIVQARSELHDELRTTLLDRLDPDALLTFGDTEHGRDDREIWEAAWSVLPAGSPRGAHVRAQVQRLRDG